ncbi:MAG: sulfur carrier protein ThiS [Planctomycetaceae bacterium]|nr:sulfur carrier protein ThiS [Planctomycetaceae bacterium]
MQLLINGETKEFPNIRFVRELLREIGLANRPAAVERNGTVIPHKSFDTAELADGDSLEIVTLVGGG